MSIEIIQHHKIKELAGTKKNLCELTDDELKGYIQDCNNQPSQVLACVCAEWLRRQIEKEDDPRT